MKKQAKKLAAYYGCQVKYSGKTQTMYVHGDNADEAIVAIRALKPVFAVE